MTNQIDKRLQMDNFPSWIIEGVCNNKGNDICNLGYACDGCPYNDEAENECERCEAEWNKCPAGKDKIDDECIESRCKYYFNWTPKQDKEEISPFAMGELEKLEQNMKNTYIFTEEGLLTLDEIVKDTEAGWHEHDIKIITDIKAKATNESPDASPSIPSMRFTALVTPTIHKTVKG
jgi:hypothetical protein